MFSYILQLETQLIFTKILTLKIQYENECKKSFEYL